MLNYKNYMNVKNLRQYKNIFFLIMEKILASVWSTKLVWMLGMYLQISNELNQDILRYRKFLFGYIDPLYCKIVISMPKIIFQ